MESKGRLLAENGIGGRVSRLETQFESMNASVNTLVRNQERNAERTEKEFGELRQLILEKSKQPLSTWISMAFLVIALFGMGLTPMWIKLASLESRANDSMRYSEADKTFKEVETQFRGVQREMQTQIDNNKTYNDSQTKEIDLLRTYEKQDSINIGKVQQELVDHDAFLWPRVQQNSDQINNLSVEERSEERRVG